jgi:hypothetical protein
MTLGRSLVSGATRYQMRLAACYPLQEGCEGVIWIDVGNRGGEETGADVSEMRSYRGLGLRAAAAGEGCHGATGIYAGGADWETWRGPAVCWALNAGHGIQGNGRGAGGGTRHDQPSAAEISAAHPSLVVLGSRRVETFSVATARQRTV